MLCIPKLKRERGSSCLTLAHFLHVLFHTFSFPDAFFSMLAATVDSCGLQSGLPSKFLTGYIYRMYNFEATVLLLIFFLSAGCRPPNPCSAVTLEKREGKKTDPISAYEQEVGQHCQLWFLLISAGTI